MPTTKRNPVRPAQHLDSCSHGMLRPYPLYSFHVISFVPPAIKTNSDNRANRMIPTEKLLQPSETPHPSARIEADATEKVQHETFSGTGVSTITEYRGLGT
jgi:hypothetical protein